MSARRRRAARSSTSPLQSTFALSWATKTLGYRGTFLSIIVVAWVVQFLSQPLGAAHFAHRHHQGGMPDGAAGFIPDAGDVLRRGSQRSLDRSAAGICLATVPHLMFYGAVGDILAGHLPGAGALPACRWPTSSARCWSAAVRRYWPSGFSTVPAASSAWLSSACYALVSLACPLVPVADHRVPRQRPVDRQRADAEDFVAARSGRAGTGVARPRPTSGRRSATGCAHAPLVLQQPALAPQATAIAGRGTVEPMTRWQGITMAIWLGPLARAGAHRRRRADGPWPARRNSALPHGTSRSACQTVRVKPRRSAPTGSEAHRSTVEVAGEFRLDPVDGAKRPKPLDPLLFCRRFGSRSTPGGRRIPAGAGPRIGHHEHGAERVCSQSALEQLAPAATAAASPATARRRYGSRCRSRSWHPVARRSPAPEDSRSATWPRRRRRAISRKVTPNSRLKARRTVDGS